MQTATSASELEKYHVSADSVNDERTQVINHYDTFCIFNLSGDIRRHGKKAHGIFFKGTRYINQLELLLNNRKPLLLNSSIRKDNEVLTVDLTNPAMPDHHLIENMVHIRRQQFIRNGVYYEDISLVNYCEETCQLEISLVFGADFSDIFEIRGMQRHVQPAKPERTAERRKILFEYKGLDHIRRTTEILFKEADNCTVTDNMVHFPVLLKKGQPHLIQYVIDFIISDDGVVGYMSVPDFADIKKNIQSEIQKGRNLFAGIHSNNENFNQWLIRSQTDIQSLLAQTQHGMYPYAGVPWYNTAFGRDGIITAMEVLWLAPEVAKEALLFLAQTQSSELNAVQDAEPGKIIHEMRASEMANTGEVPFRKYYGTIDATPLFLMLAGMYYEQTADLATIKKIWPNIKAAVAWIDTYGDTDNDGFVEYRSKTKEGLTNQGWKDSYDAIMYADGRLCEPPIALCEVQGYVYAAKKHVAVIAKAMDETEYGEIQDKAARALKKRFNEAFWNAELGSFSLALDGNKNPCNVIASNAGHCLFTGIAYEEHAKKAAERLLSAPMFTGWGIRTLASTEVRYNPMSYHNGSVWPHDNALIAFGLAKYGLQEDALKVMHGLFNASLFIDLQRLPELFCGFDQQPKDGPTAYPVACSPQAWAVGAIFLMLQACLQLTIDGLHKTIQFNKPRLPEFLKHLTITNLKLGNESCNFEIFRHKEEVSFRVIYKPEDWEFIIKQ